MGQYFADNLKKYFKKRVKKTQNWLKKTNFRIISISFWKLSNNL